MKNSLFYLALLSLYLVHQISGQTVVTVNTATYFNNNVGGGPNHCCGLNYNGPIFCRDQGEVATYGGPSQTSCPQNSFSTPPLDQGRWGQSALNVATQMSGLGFQGIVNTPVSPGQDFFLGQLTHFNWPIYGGTAASSIQMNIFFTFTVAGSTNVKSYLFPFTMLVDETPNQPPCAYPGTVPCSDKISFNTSFNFNTTFTVDNSGVSYTLILEGFKESNSSSSSPVSFFISNENENSQAFLFARITEACPSTCVNGGSYIVNSNNDCSCDCSNVNCGGAQTTAPNCTCECPASLTCANGGYINGSNVNCPCVCSNTCPAPQVRNPADCSCACPSNYCHAGGTISNPTTCACTCPTTPCPIANQTRNSTCDCVCAITCPSQKVLSNATGVCGCMCAQSCAQKGYGPGYTENADCSCSCTQQCVHSTLNPTTCTCSPCQGNWVVDNTTGQCTNCTGVSSATCAQSNQAFDPNSCSCVCVNAGCNLNATGGGTVVNKNVSCGCRPCAAGECICGNGIVEAGEQCDVGSANDSCCVKCQFTTNPCDDGNGCTDNSFCNGNGTCNPGEYKCDAPTDCANITCIPSVGVCTTTPFDNGTSCGGLDLCNARCMSGVCQKSVVTCAPDNSTTDCIHPACIPSTGVCGYVNNNDSTSCSDNDPCTSNDGCIAGTCIGTPILCSAPDQCHNATCEYGICVPFSLENHPCNADNNACTVGDSCSGGTCLPGVAKVCNSTGQCTGATCNATTGQCGSFVIPSSWNQTCTTNNICIYNEFCVNGSCVGTKNPKTVNDTACGFIPVDAPSAKAVKTTSIAIFAAIGAATLIGAIIGLAVLVKRIRANKLLNPDTWNPDMFSSVGSNPLYKGSSNAMDNALYEGAK